MEPIKNVAGDIFKVKMSDFEILISVSRGGNKP